MIIGSKFGAFFYCDFSYTHYAIQQRYYIHTIHIHKNKKTIMKKNLIFASLVLCTSFTMFTMENEKHQKRNATHWHGIDDIDDNYTTTASSTTQAPQASITHPQKDIHKISLKIL